MGALILKGGYGELVKCVSDLADSLGSVGTFPASGGASAEIGCTDAIGFSTRALNHDFLSSVPRGLNVVIFFSDDSQFPKAVPYLNSSSGVAFIHFLLFASSEVLCSVA